MRSSAAQSDNGGCAKTLRSTRSMEGTTRRKRGTGNGENGMRQPHLRCAQGAFHAGV
jgi:hypothetical protein